jgi:hypothetical protein
MVLIMILFEVIGVCIIFFINLFKTRKFLFYDKIKNGLQFGTVLEITRKFSEISRVAGAVGWSVGGHAAMPHGTGSGPADGPPAHPNG